MTSYKEIVEKRTLRRQKRTEKFYSLRKQTEQISSCHGCFWLNLPWGNTPCKTCKTYDSSRNKNKYKGKDK